MVSEARSWEQGARSGRREEPRYARKRLRLTRRGINHKERRLTEARLQRSTIREQEYKKIARDPSTSLPPSPELQRGKQDDK